MELSHEEAVLLTFRAQLGRLHILDTGSSEMEKT